MRISDWSSDVCSSDLLLADLRGGGEAWAARRHPRRQRLSPADDGERLAVLLRRGLCRAVGRFPEPAPQPDRGGRVREASGPEGRADRVRLYLAAELDVACRQDVARRPARDALGRPDRKSTRLNYSHYCASRL